MENAKATSLGDKIKVKPPWILAQRLRCLNQPPPCAPADDSVFTHFTSHTWPGPPINIHPCILPHHLYFPTHQSHWNMIDRQRPLAKSSDLSLAPRHSFLITSSSLERGTAIKEKGKPFIYTLQSFNFSEVFRQSSFMSYSKTTCLYSFSPEVPNILVTLSYVTPGVCETRSEQPHITYANSSEFSRCIHFPSS